MPQNIFFIRALTCAKEDPESFAELFETKDADPNLCKYGEYGEPLIHQIIYDLPDVDLPALLTVLIEKKVDLKTTNSGGFTPLAFAANMLKINALKFLIKINTDISQLGEALHGTILADPNPNFHHIKIRIFNLLLEHNADVNFILLGMPVLQRAVEASSQEMMRMLILKGADIKFKFSYVGGLKGDTAFAAAYRIVLKYR